MRHLGSVVAAVQVNCYRTSQARADRTRAGISSSSNPSRSRTNTAPC